MSDFIVFWMRHNQFPALSDFEQLVFCAATRHAGYCLTVPQSKRKFRLRRGGER